jgi:hypothetical protein
MRGRRDQRIERLHQVAREYTVLAWATRVLHERLVANPADLKERELKHKDFERAVQNLSATYLIRLFAEFETGLREAWRRAYRRRTHPRTVELLDAFAARCSISQDWHDAADDVRKYRNALVHEEDETIAPITVATAGRSLRRFFSRLPLDW